MSSLMVVHDSRLVLLEVAIEKLYMPKVDVFDEALMKKTIIMFRMLDDEWTALVPNRRDYRSYRGSNYETEYFYGGRSVLFSLPESVLEREVSGVDLQLYVYRAISKYFELDPRRNFGFTLVRVDDLLNSIIKDLGERKELEGYFSKDLEREPISRSTRGTFALLNDNLQTTEATIELYVRISYLGKCVITELHTPMSLQKAFYAREETDERYRYQLRELNTMDLESFCWGSMTILPPLHPDKLICYCKEKAKADEEARIRAEIAAKLRAERKAKLRAEREARAKALLAQLQRKGGSSRRKRKPSGLSLAALLEQQRKRIQKLLALLKELRKNRPVGMAHGEEPKTVCPTTTNVCSPVCVPPIPFACTNPCQLATVCCPPVTR